MQTLCQNVCLTCATLTQKILSPGWKTCKFKGIKLACDWLFECKR